MFELTYPWALLVLPLPLLVWFFYPKASASLSLALKVPFYADLSMLLSQQNSFISRRQPMLLFFCSWCMLCIALAGPHWVGAPRALAHEGYNIMLALDISPSMGINDMNLHNQRATRLDVVKRAARQFVQDRTGDNLGLILFGERAYLYTPLTYDRQTVLMRLEDASVGLAGKSTSLGDALGLAIKRLRMTPPKGRVIILLTDGISNSGVLSPLKAAELAHQEGIKVYTIGLHSEIDPHSFSGLFLNANSAADLDEKTLKTVANITGGRYFRATDLASLQHIYQDIDNMTRVSQDSASARPKRDYAPWFLALGLLLLMGVLAQQSCFFINVRIKDVA